jgi:hypothetical protein
MMISLIACDLFQLMAILCTVHSRHPSAPTSISLTGGAWKLPLPPPGLSQRQRKKGKQEETTLPYSLRALWPSPPPSACSTRPEDSLSTSSSASSGMRLPISGVDRKYKIDLLHRSSANRSRILKRSLLLPVSLRTSAHRIFCCGRHRKHRLKRCSRVCVLCPHHPHFALGCLLVHFRYWPIFCIVFFHELSDI